MFDLLIFDVFVCVGVCVCASIASLLTIMIKGSCGSYSFTYIRPWQLYTSLAIITGSIARSANLPLFSLLRGQF